LRCAQAAAFRELVDVLTQIGGEEAAVQAISGYADALQKEFAAAIKVPGADGDPREEAAAIAFGLVDAANDPELVDRLAAAPAARDRIDWREALLARALLEAGRVEAGRARAAAIDAAIGSLEFPLRPDAAAYHTTLCFGVLGIRREDLGTLEFV